MPANKYDAIKFEWILLRKHFSSLWNNNNKQNTWIINNIVL